MPREPEGAEHSILLLAAIGVQIQNLNREFEQTCGISMVQWCVMKCLRDLPGSSAHEVAEEVGVHPSTLTQTLRRLETKLFIVVDPHPRDARRKVIYVTRSGNTALKRLAKMASATLSAVDLLNSELVSISEALECGSPTRHLRAD